MNIAGKVTPCCLLQVDRRFVIADVQIFHENYTERQGQVGRTSVSYLAGPEFKPQLGSRLSPLRFSVFSSAPLDKCRDCITN
jgi:hypothetical protein